MKFSIYIVIISSILILFLKCNEETVELNNTDLIFHNSLYLKVEPYSYTGEQGNTYFCRGDTFYYTTIPDTFDAKPLIKWDSIGFNILAVSIFTSPVVVEDNTIKNSNDIIWQWNSGMKIGYEGEVKYIEGKYVINGITDYYQVPGPLNSGLYYWAVWGWTNDGTKILYSSRQMSFYVQ